MNLSDVMSRAGLSSYAELALVLFTAAFLAVLLHLFVTGRRSAIWERARHLPLEGDPPALDTPPSRKTRIDS